VACRSTSCEVIRIACFIRGALFRCAEFAVASLQCMRALPMLHTYNANLRRAGNGVACAQRRVSCTAHERCNPEFVRIGRGLQSCRGVALRRYRSRADTTPTIGIAARQPTSPCDFKESRDSHDSTRGGVSAPPSDVHKPPACPRRGKRCAHFASATATGGAQLAKSLSESSDSAPRRALIAHESTTGQILRRENVNQEEFGGRRRALLRSRLFHHCHHCSDIRLWRYCSRRGRNRESSFRCISRSGDHHLSQTRVAHYALCGARFASAFLLGRQPRDDRY
jgi:hypothetical protein